MKIDLYTKLMLTVIAFALVGLVAQNYSTNAIAQGAVQKVAICDPNDANSCAAVGKRGSSSFDSLAVTDVKGM